jgi:hypothetical protein
MVLVNDLPFHVDLAMTVALPKIAADFNQLASCAEKLFIEGCPGVTADLDLPQGFYLAPSAIPLYRIDRPDDPVANEHDIKTLVTMLQDVVGNGTFSGHDYVIRKQPDPALTTCKRSYQQCLVGGILCSTKTEDVEYFASPAPTTYVGMYGVDTFHLACNQNGGVLEYRCDAVTKVASTYCKAPPGGGDRVCIAKPSDCP